MDGTCIHISFYISSLTPVGRQAIEQYILNFTWYKFNNLLEERLPRAPTGENRSDLDPLVRVDPRMRPHYAHTIVAPKNMPCASRLFFKNPWLLILPGSCSNWILFLRYAFFCTLWSFLLLVYNFIINFALVLQNIIRAIMVLFKSLEDIRPYK